MNEDVIRRALGRLRLPPHSLRWRLQLWQGFLVVSMMVGFGLTIYRLQTVNRFRQVDADLETRVTALSRAVREVYRDTAPGPVRSSGSDRRGRPQRPQSQNDKRIVENPPPSMRETDDKSDPGPGRNGGPGTERRPEPGARGPGRAFDADAGREPGPDGGRGPDWPPGPGPDGRGPSFDGGPERGGGFGPGAGRAPRPRPPGQEPHGPPPFGRPMPPPEEAARGSSDRQNPGRGGSRSPRPEQSRAEPPPPPQKPADVPLSAETEQLFASAAGGYYFVIWYRDGTVLKRSSSAPADSPRPSSPERDTLPHYRTRGDYREEVHCSGLGDCVMAGRPMKADLAASSAFGWTLLGAGVVIVILGFGLGWWLIGRAIRPVEEIASAATRIARGNLSERINIGSLDDELGRLAEVLNSTFARLEAAFVRQQEFTSNAAHELRTPLSILISEAQTALARPRTAEEYRETVEGGLETAQQMRKITETLLELARFDAGDPSVSREVVDLAQAAARCVERIEPVAARNGVPIKKDLAPALALVAPERLEVVVVNLLTNALYYNKPGGSVRLETYSEKGTAVLQVSDTGIGIASEDVPHIFDRFYRADKARSRAHGHAGLGLAICKTIIEAERGEISVLSKPQEGTTFIVRFASAQAINAVGLLKRA